MLDTSNGCVIIDSFTFSIKNARDPLANQQPALLNCVNGGFSATWRVSKEMEREAKRESLRVSERCMLQNLILSGKKSVPSSPKWSDEETCAVCKPEIGVQSVAIGVIRSWREFDEGSSVKLIEDSWPSQ